MKKIFLLLVAAIFLAGAGCVSSQGSGDSSAIASFPLTEPEWIRNGEPVEFEGESWYPTREVESFMDNEVYPVIQLRDVQFYIDRTDIKPFQRLYTSFSKNHYRTFEKQP